MEERTQNAGLENKAAGALYIREITRHLPSKRRAEPLHDKTASKQRLRLGIARGRKEYLHMINGY